VEDVSPLRLPLSQKAAHGTKDAIYYLLAALSGIATGFADVAVNDLLFTALLVLLACMLLGMLRPRGPWRWVVAMVGFIPITELTAFLVTSVRPTRGQVYGSFLTALPGIAGAYGGAVVRRAIDNLRQGK
jgi:ABC-type multidrug transport system permease subunit